MSGGFHRAQGALYLLVLFLFVGVTVAQMQWRPTRYDRPTNNFGGNFVFLTVQTNFIILGYVVICVFDYMSGRKVNLLVKMVERLTGTVCTIGFIMGSMYYALVHFHPLTRARAEEVQNFDFYMHLLHGVPLVFVIFELLFRERTHRRPVADMISAESYMVFYCTWSIFCAHMNNGWWPYSFQQGMKIWQHVAFDLVMGLFLIPVVSLGSHVVRGRGVQLLRSRRRKMNRTSSAGSFVGSYTEVIDSCVDVLDSCSDVIDTCSSEVASVVM